MYAVSSAFTGGERFTTITPDDHGGYVYIATFMAMTYSTLTFITRCLVKRRMFGLDDWAVVVAQALLFGQFAAILAALSAGLGKNFDLLDDGQFFGVVRSQFANQILLYFSLCAAKCSVVLLIQRLFTRDMKHFWAICNIFLGLVVLWGITAALLVTVGCSPSDHIVGDTSPRCSGYLTRYKVISALDVVTELLLVLVPMYLVSYIQMKTKLKLRVVLAFAFRLPVAVFSLLHLVSLLRTKHSPNAGVALATVAAFQQAQLGYSLISATIPCLKSFVKSFDTGLGLEVGYSTNPYGYGSRNGSGNGGSGRHGAGESYRLDDLSKGSTGGSVIDYDNKAKGRLRRPGKTNRGVLEISAPVRPDGQPGGLRPEKLENTTSIYHSTRPESVEGDSARDGSEELIIRREFKWDVRSDLVTGKK